MVELKLQEVLNGALSLNGDDKKYVITVEGNKIITTVKWMDAVFFAPDTITDEVQQFKFIAKLNDNRTWLEIDESKAVKRSVGMGGFNMNYSSFKGKEISFNKTIAIGKNRDDNSVGVVKISFNSEEYKKPVSEYLARCGYKKTTKGFFASLFGR